MNITLSKNMAAFNDLELRGYLHSLIEKAKDRTELLLFAKAVAPIFEENAAMDYDNEVAGWGELSGTQQATLKTAIEESNHVQNLVPHEHVLKMMDKWLTE